MILKKSLKRAISLIVVVFFLLTLYLVTAYTLAFFPTKTIASKKTQTIYVLYNNMHSDIVLGLSTTTQAWEDILSTLIKNKKGYIAFGWGDKETYINTPTWSELKVSTTLKALFLNTPSLMHVSYISDIKEYQKIKKVEISQEQLEKLESTILKNFNFTNKKFSTYKGYGRDDLFYDSIKKYNIFKTCNTWTGDTLREANISISYWTPLSSNVIRSLP